MKKFHLTNRYAMINFDALMATSQVSIVNSRNFTLLLKDFVKKLKEEKHDLIDRLSNVTGKQVSDLYKQLLIHDVNTAFKNVKGLSINSRKDLYLFTEELYDYWRNLTRFGFLKGSKSYSPQLKVADLLTSSSNFNESIIKLYRNIAQKLGGNQFHVFRNLPAGTNTNVLYIRHEFTNNETYSNIQNIPFVTKISTSPPFIINSKSNTRTGLFTEIDENPLPKLSINKSHYFAFPIKVGPLTAFVYIHRDFMHQGIALANLFQFADYNKFRHEKPDLVFVYGIRENEYDCKYFVDEDEDMLVGFVSRSDKNDYFGYLKKMLLTLHNVKMIKDNKLPIHGAMVQIKLNNNKIKNVVVMGDSGAGKSETLEALRVIGKDQIKKMDIVFDDMGTFKLDNKNKIISNGTETGAFIRLDDLDSGYAFEIMDRSMFLNPTQVNARVVVPISSYDFIMTDNPVDLLLYANNYDADKSGLNIFNNKEDALKIFKRGRRKAKGTTSEVGIVESYFANPFGPIQLKNDTEKLLDLYFTNLYDNNIPVGELYTKLAVSGMETKGPQEAAQLLLDYLLSK